MTAQDTAHSPDCHTLRTFGLVTGAVFVGLFGLALPWLRRATLPRWPWIVAVPLILLALAAPGALRGVYRIWMRFGRVLGAVNSRIILAILFFLVITPAGLVMRLLGRDPLARQFDQDAASYRLPAEPNEVSSMEKPF
jgi:hypothetical protein